MTKFSQHSVPNALTVFSTQLPNGGSAPRVCDFDDMVLRLVKWHPSNHGHTATYSELVASRLAQLIEAPVVRGSVVYVSNDLLPPGLSSRVSQPFHVGFTYLSGKNFSKQDYTDIKNKASLPAAAVHLAWLQVGDQEGHNQLLYQLEQVLPDDTRRKMNHFILVDQAFICGTSDWRNAPLNEPNSPYDLPSHLKSQVSFESLEMVIEQVKAADIESVRGCFESYPETWDIGTELVDKVTDYILKRRDHLENILRANFS